MSTVSAFFALIFSTVFAFSAAADESCSVYEMNLIGSRRAAAHGNRAPGAVAGGEKHVEEFVHQTATVSAETAERGVTSEVAAELGRLKAESAIVAKPSPARAEAQLSRHDSITRDLYNGRITSVRRFSQNDNKHGLYVVQIEGRDHATGEIRQREAFFKPRTYGDEDGWARAPMEYVAYGLNRLLDMDYVPPTAYRRGLHIETDGQVFTEGAFILKAQDFKPLAALPGEHFPAAHDVTISDNRVLNVLMHNQDGHYWNLGLGKSWVDGAQHPVFIDWGASLRPGTKVSMTEYHAYGNSSPVASVSRRTFEAMQRLKADDFRGMVDSNLLSWDEAHQILGRRDGIVAYFKGIQEQEAKKIGQRAYETTVIGALANAPPAAPFVPRVQLSAGVAGQGELTVFRAAFDPPSAGEVEAVKNHVRETGASEVLILVDGKGDEAHRKMAELAFSAIPQARFPTPELRRELAGKSASTVIDHLARLNSQVTALGHADELGSDFFGTTKAKNVKYEIAARKGDPSTSLLSDAAHAKGLDSRIRWSETAEDAKSPKQIRFALVQKEAELPGLPPDVAEFIGQNHLYSAPGAIAANPETAHATQLLAESRARANVLAASPRERTSARRGVVDSITSDRNFERYKDKFPGRTFEQVIDDPAASARLAELARPDTEIAARAQAEAHATLVKSMRESVADVAAAPAAKSGFESFRATAADLEEAGKKADAKIPAGKFADSQSGNRAFADWGRRFGDSKSYFRGMALDSHDDLDAILSKGMEKSRSKEISLAKDPESAILGLSNAKNQGSAAEAMTEDAHRVPALQVIFQVDPASIPERERIIEGANVKVGNDIKSAAIQKVFVFDKNANPDFPFTELSPKQAKEKLSALDPKEERANRLAQDLIEAHAGGKNDSEGLRTELAAKGWSKPEMDHCFEQKICAPSAEAYPARVAESDAPKAPARKAAPASSLPAAPEPSRAIAAVPAATESVGAMAKRELAGIASLPKAELAPLSDAIAKVAKTPEAARATLDRMHALAANPDMFETYRLSYQGAADALAHDPKLTRPEAWERGIEKMLLDSGYSADEIKKSGLVRKTAVCLTM